LQKIRRLGANQNLQLTGLIYFIHYTTPLLT
jgi:hypothetical protein